MSILDTASERERERESIDVDLAWYSGQHERVPLTRFASRNVKSARCWRYIKMRKRGWWIQLQRVGCVRVKRGEFLPSVVTLFKYLAWLFRTRTCIYNDRTCCCAATFCDIIISLVSRVPPQCSNAMPRSQSHERQYDSALDLRALSPRDANHCLPCA